MSNSLQLHGLQYSRPPCPSPTPRVYSNSYPLSQCWMWELDYKESWAPKNWCFWTVVLEKTVESPLDCRQIQSVLPKGDQSWVFIGRTDLEAETPILWPPDVKNWLIWKDPGCWERLKIEGEGDDRGWDGWMASPAQWTWIWVNSGSWWWTGWSGVLQSMGVTKSQTQLSEWTELIVYSHTKRSCYIATVWEMGPRYIH